MFNAVPLAVALMLGGEGAWAQVYYRAQALPELPPQGPFGQGWTLGWALNDSGTIVGQSQAVSAVRWSFADGLQNIGSPARAYGLANNGTAVGYLDFGSSLGVKPVRWSPTSGFAPLSDVYAGAPVNGMAWAVNNQDWVLAYEFNVLGGDPNLMLLRPGQAALNLGPSFIGSIQGGPMVNNRGMVASTTFTNLGGVGINEGFIWTEAGGARTFSAGAANTRLTGLNDNGLVVGWTHPGGADPSNGFVYNAYTGTLLQTLPGFMPTDINDTGAIVGLQNIVGVPQGTAAAEWRNGAAVNLNSVTADLGVYHLTQALDINASGQILAFGVVKPDAVPTNYNGPALRSFLLSECARCGQIKPNPNPASALLDVGPDWFDAFNAEDYRNQGTLQIRTGLANVQGAVLRNGGDIDILAPAGRLFNTGSLDNGPGGRIVVSGSFDTGGAGGVINRAAVRVLEGGSMFLGGSAGFVNQSLSRFTQVGGSVRNEALFSVEKALFDQQGGSFQNGAGGIFKLEGGDAVVGVSFTNLGTLLMESEALAPIGSPSRSSQMRIAGVLDNQAGAVFNAEGGSLIEVDGGQLRNRGNLMLLNGSTSLRLRNGGFLVNDGGTLRLGSGNRLLIDADAGSLQQLSGNVFVANGARIEIGQTRDLDVVGGRISNEGVIVARSAARIANSGSFRLQTGSRLELDGGATFDQGAGELLVAAGASIVGGGLLNHFGGTTTVNGSVSLPMSIFNGGVLAGSGFIGGNVVLGSTIDLRPGNSPGTITFLGDVDMADARIELQIDSHRSYDKIVVAGHLIIGQVSVKLAPAAGYTPDLNDSFTWLSFGSTSGNALQLDTSLLPSGWRSVAGTAAGTLALWNDAAVALAPNPNPVGALLRVAADTLAYNDLDPVAAGTYFDNLGTVEVAGALANRPGAYFVQRDGARLHVLAGGRLSNRGYITELGGGASTVDNAGTLINYHDGAIDVRNLANRGRIENDGTLNIQQGLENEAGGEVVNRGRMSRTFNLSNRGHFENQGLLDEFGFITNTSGAEFVVAEGGTVEASPFSFGEYRDFGGITRVDGRLQANLIRLQGTWLKGHGTLVGPTELLGAEVAPDVGTGLTIDGSVTGNATFYIGWTSAGLYSRLHVTGNLSLQPGRVYFVLSPDGYLPQAGDRLQWLSVDGSAQGLDALDWRIVTQANSAACAGCELYDWTAPSDIRVSFNGGVLSLRPVPEPSAWVTMLFGLAALSGLARRRLARGTTGT